MIDFHNHILPNVDDGPTNIQETIKLLNQAKEEGVTEIIVTPHHLHTKYYNSVCSIKKKINELFENEEIKRLGIKFYVGQELRITDQVINEIKSGNIEGINQSRYLLIEFPSNEVPHYTKNLFYDIQTMGYTPIIAHPERNKVISEDLDVLFELINGGALSQITSSSLMGDFGNKVRKLSIQMINNNLTHFIGSDAHNVESRPFLMKTLFEDKKLKNYQDDLEDFLNNAQHVVNNEKLRKKKPDQSYKYKKWFGLF